MWIGNKTKIENHYRVNKNIKMETFVNIVNLSSKGLEVVKMCKKEHIPYCTFDIYGRYCKDAIDNFHDIDSIITYSEEQNDYNVFLVECDELVDVYLEKMSRSCKKSTYIYLYGDVDSRSLLYYQNKYEKERVLQILPFVNFFGPRTLCKL